MTTWAIILRGINVGGARKLPMKDLQAILGAHQCRRVRTYIQSGNAVCESDHGDPKALAASIEAAIRKSFGFDVPVLVRSINDMKRTVQRNPYIGRKGIDPEKLHVTFLASAPEPARIAQITGSTFANDSFEVIGLDAYVHCPDGYGNTKLNNTWFESRLKVKATTRNWRTVNELVRIGGELEQER